MNRKNKKWLRSRDQRKTPKVFIAQFEQLQDGSFRMIGGETKVLINKNQHSSEWVNVDTRDFATELNMNSVRSL